MAVVISIVRGVMVLLIALLIIAVGWNEPLRYRFMSTEEIFRIENPPPPATPQPVIQFTPPRNDDRGPKGGNWMWDPTRATNPLREPDHR